MRGHGGLELILVCLLPTPLWKQFDGRTRCEKSCRSRFLDPVRELLAIVHIRTVAIPSPFQILAERKCRGKRWRSRACGQKRFVKRTEPFDRDQFREMLEKSTFRTCL